MRAAIVRTPGGPEVIEIVDVPIPAPGMGEIRLRVEAATVNPVDAQTRGGVYHQLGWVSVPEVGLGWDVVGTVDAIGAGVEGYTGGERVAAVVAGVDRGPGAYAEQVVVPVTNVARVPLGLSVADAATVPLNATTAQQTLDRLGAPVNRRLLVTGAGGAVGGYVVELAVALGYQVTGLARPADEVFVRAAGAAFIDALPAQADFDAAIDAAAIGDSVVASIVDDGHYVGVVPPAVPASVRGIQTEAVMVDPDGQLLPRLLDAAAAGRITPRVHGTMPLEDAGVAHRLLDAGGLRGRIVLIP